MGGRQLGGGEWEVSLPLSFTSLVVEEMEDVCVCVCVGGGGESIALHILW